MPSRTTSRSRTCRTRAGNFITPSLDSVKAAANLPSYPADLRFNLVNTDAAQGYPIAGTTWLIVVQGPVEGDQEPGPRQGAGRLPLVGDPRRPGRRAPLFYGSIPANLLAQDEAAVKSINWAGTPLLP